MAEALAAIGGLRSNAIKKLTVVPLCGIGGALLLITAFVFMVADSTAHERECDRCSEPTQVLDLTLSLIHRLHILFIVCISALLGLCLWFVALLVALERL